MWIFIIKPVFLFLVSLHFLSLSLIECLFTLHLTCLLNTHIISLLRPEKGEGGRIPKHISIERERGELRRIQE
ncbi:hypothetical protein BDV96DRAFT_570804 [Lophiotrema nucula]|uniref:Uncharacterized protein n=1 Tax=Lophiotrema nucula TaxID=690887 RepID=A0A6A5ZDY5_9PLEO|nr:hypothetical protein BDV96DRAFT_570804 [Lophiotrema nucula]